MVDTHSPLSFYKISIPYIDIKTYKDAEIHASVSLKRWYSVSTVHLRGSLFSRVVRGILRSTPRCRICGKDTIVLTPWSSPYLSHYFDEGLRISRIDVDSSLDRATVSGPRSRPGCIGSLYVLIHCPAVFPHVSCSVLSFSGTLAGLRLDSLATVAHSVVDSFSLSFSLSL